MTGADKSRLYAQYLCGMIGEGRLAEAVRSEDASGFPPTPEEWGELLGNRNTRMSVKVHVDPAKGSPTGEVTLIDRETGQRETVRTSAAAAERLLRRFGHK